MNFVDFDVNTSALSLKKDVDTPSGSAVLSDVDLRYSICNGSTKLLPKAFCSTLQRDRERGRVN